MALVDGRPAHIKVCEGPNCGRRGVCLDGPDSDFAIKDRGPDGRITAWHPLCKPCYNEAQRVYRLEHRDEMNAARRQRHAERMASDPEYARRKRRATRDAQRRRAQDPAKLELMRERSKVWHRRHKAEDPEGVREMDRMYYRLRVERAGGQVAQKPKRGYTTVPLFPAGPLVAYLVAYKAERGITENDMLAYDLGLSTRRVRSLLGGEQEKVSVDVISAALTGAVVEPEVDGRVVFVLDDLYPADKFPLAA